MIKKIISLFILFSMIIALSPITMSKSEAAGSKKINILFIGNSKTYYNNMPAMLGNMLTKSGEKINYKVLVKGSMSLNFHYHYIKEHEEQIKSLFNDEKIDYVILNEQTDVQLAPFGTRYDSKKTFKKKRIFGNLSEDAKRVLTRLHTYGMIDKKKTKIILNATWNYADDLEDIDITNENFKKTKQVIQNAGYKNCEIAYSGTVIKNVSTEMDKVNGILTKQELFLDENKPRNKHTTQVGSYIEALAIYRAMFDSNMVANYAGSVSAEKMQQSIDKYVKIEDFIYKGLPYSNEENYMEKAFNEPKLPKVKDYQNIIKFVNKALDKKIKEEKEEEKEEEIVESFDKKSK